MLINKFKSLAIACTTLVLGMSAASAQDVSQWTGGYVGLNLQYGSGEASWHGSATNRNVDAASGFNYGIHAGYAFAAGDNLFGVELGYASGLGDQADINCNVAKGGVAGARQCEREITDVFTLGGTYGRAFGASTLGFISAGYASAEMDAYIYKISDGRNHPTTTRVSSKRHDGYYIGLGMRQSLSEKLLLSVEIRHYEFSTSTQQNYLVDGSAHSSKLTDVNGKATNLTVGLSMRF